MEFIKRFCKWLLIEPERSPEKSEDNPTTKPESHNKTPYWQCQGCGAVHSKPEHIEAIGIFKDLGSPVLGGVTCPECNTRHSVADIAAGKCDMLDPKEIVASAIADKDNTLWDEVQKKWIYKGEALIGSEKFGIKFPTQFDEWRGQDGDLVAICVHITSEKILNNDVDIIEEISTAIMQEVQKRGVVVPCILNFSGYDDDPRPIWEIPEIRKWCAKVIYKAPYFPALLAEQIANPFSWSVLNIGKVTNSGEGTSLTEIDLKEWLEHLEYVGKECIKFLLDAGMEDEDVNNWIGEWITKRGNDVSSKSKGGMSDHKSKPPETRKTEAKETEKKVEDGSPEMELWNAVKNNDLDAARIALENGSVPNPYYNDGTRALEQACHNGNLSMAQLLLTEGAKFEPSYIHAIVGSGQELEESTELLSYWIDNGADVNLVDNYHPVGGHAQMTPLHRAAFYADIEKARLLIANGAIIDQPAYDGETALQIAVTSGLSTKVRFVQMLLEHGADPSNQKNDGSTPLHSAASYGSIEMIKILLEHGAEINAIANSYGASPLDIAELEGRTEAIKFLEENGGRRVKNFC